MDEQILKISGRKKTTSKNSSVGGCCGGGCGCYNSNLHCYHSFLILRWFLGLVILVLVFCLGMKIGELKAQFGLGHFDGNERGWYGMNRSYSPRLIEDFDTISVKVYDEEKTTATTSKTKK